MLKHTKSLNIQEKLKIIVFLNDLDKVFPVKDSINKGYHHMELHDHRISLELLFTGVNFDVQLFEEDC